LHPRVRSAHRRHADRRRYREARARRAAQLGPDRSRCTRTRSNAAPRDRPHVRSPETRMTKESPMATLTERWLRPRTPRTQFPPYEFGDPDLVGLAEARTSTVARIYHKG